MSDILSITPSNALNFGTNTSLSIRTKNRTLEVGDQKELVAENVLFVLQRWISSRSKEKDANAAINISISVNEMPSGLQRDIVRHFDTSPVASYVDLLQDPPFLYSWNFSAKEKIVSEYASLFERVFAASPSKSNDNLKKYILLHDTWAAELIVYLNSSGNFYRICADLEPLTHYLSDHFASVDKCDLSCFSQVNNLDALLGCLKRLNEDYSYFLPELIVPTGFTQLEEVEKILESFKRVIPGLTFEDNDRRKSTREVSHGTYLLHLKANPSSRDLERSKRSSMILEFSTPGKMDTMDAGSIQALTEAVKLVLETQPANEAPTSDPQVTL